MQRTITMLIADDSQVTQQIVTDAARASKLPLRLTSTDNGRECLTLLNGANIDLAFIDVHMPELSGTQAFWSARKQGIQTFVALMSTPPAAEAVELAVKLHAYEFLFKPFTVNDALGIMNTYARISSPSKILIVDDSSSVRHIVQKVVHGSLFNCELAEAGDGESALTLARITAFDAIFLDRNMPGLDGLATMKRLQLIQPSLKVIMMSAERDIGKEHQALQAGACAFLQKPFRSEDVDKVLHTAFGLRSPNLKLTASEPHFDVAIEGSTIRVAHKSSGHIFEYLWSQTPPYLRNAVGARRLVLRNSARPRGAGRRGNRPPATAQRPPARRLSRRLRPIAAAVAARHNRRDHEPGGERHAENAGLFRRKDHPYHRRRERHRPRHGADLRPRGR